MNDHTIASVESALEIAPIFLGGKRSAATFIGSACLRTEGIICFQPCPAMVLINGTPTTVSTVITKGMK
jgi:hypothetical protein